jgi:hypothetical protein
MTYGRIATKQARSAYLATVDAILAGVHDLSDHAESACPSLRLEEQSIDLLESAREATDYVAMRGPLEDELVAALASTLAAAGTVPARHQHGDLWHQNLLIEGRRRWVLDFEHYGTVRCPLYDDLTLLGSTLALRSGVETSGIKRLMDSEPEPASCRAMLTTRAVADGVDLSQLDGILAFHVLYRAWMVHTRAGPLHGKSPLDDVRYVAQRLARGERGLLLT